MAKGIGDIIKNRGLKKPPEIEAIKSFIYQKFKSEVEIAVKSDQITILADNAPLAGALRPYLPELKANLKTGKKLVIRIG